MDEIRDELEIEAFLKEPLSRRGREAVEKLLLGDSAVASVRFISKEEAARIFKEDFGEDIESVLDHNPLPPSFRIYLKPEFQTPGKTDSAIARFRASDRVESIAYRRDLLEFIEQQTGSLNTFGLAVGTILALSALFLVSNTIRLTIEAKRRAIQTMKLVGASRFFIRAPFLLEGAVQGALGGAIAALLLHYIVAGLAGAVSEELRKFIIPHLGLFLLIAAGGTALGILGSLMSVRRNIGESVGG